MTIAMTRPAAPARGRRRLATAVNPVRPSDLRPASYRGRRRRPSMLAGALAYALGLFT